MTDLYMPVLQPADAEMLTTTMLGNKDGVCNSMPGWDPMTHAFNPTDCESSALQLTPSVSMSKPPKR